MAAQLETRSHPGRLGLLIAGLLLVWLLLAELGLRLVWHNPYATEGPELVLKLRVHHPHADYVLDRAAIDPEHPSVRFRTDARSYVVPGRRFENPDATIVFLGGSTTEGALVQEPLRFPARVSTLLEERGLRVDTLNGGRSGNVLHDGINQLLNHVAADRPDVVVFWYLSNDLYLLETEHSYASRMGRPVDLGFASRAPLHELSSRSSITGWLRWWAYGSGPSVPPAPRRAGARHEAPALAPEPFVTRVRAALQLADAFGIKPVWMTEVLDERASTNHRRLAEAAQRAASEANAVVFDLGRHVREYVPGWQEPMALTYDGTHLSDQGSEIVARFVTEQLFAQGVLPLAKATPPSTRTP